ncbi:MAG: phage holin family protein [Syntrophothermus sp.]
MADPTQPSPPAPTPETETEHRTVAELVFDVSERASTLIREEVELAKAEVSEKVNSLLRGSAVGVAAGTFAFLALILVMEGIAWLLNEEVFDGKTWPGFFVEAALFLLVAALAGFIAYRAVQAGSPPLPEQAIEEARLTREMLAGEEHDGAAEGAAQAAAATVTATAPQATAPQASKATEPAASTAEKGPEK